MTEQQKLKTAAIRYQHTFDVFTGYREIKELPDGYLLKYPATDRWRETLEEFTERYRQTCPFFQLQLTTETERRAIWLEFRGPEGTKNFVDSSRKMLTSNLNPVPSFGQRMKWKYCGLTAGLRVLPDFVVIGAKKCGTTSLYAHLMAHPDVAPAFRKEIFYFNGNYQKGTRWYRRHFPTTIRRWAHRLIAGNPLMTGEATSEYMFGPRVSARMAELIPDAKLFAILRNPIDRAHSAFHHEVRLGRESRSFEGAFRGEEQRRKKNKTLIGPYLGRGIYVDHLYPWFEKFGRERIMVISTEQLESSPAEVYARALSFLGLRDHKLGKFQKFNAVPYPDMASETRRELADFYRPHNERLYELLDRNLGWEQSGTEEPAVTAPGEPVEEGN